MKTHLVLFEANSQLQIPLVLVELVDAIVVLFADRNQSGWKNGFDNQINSSIQIRTR